MFCLGLHDALKNAHGRLGNDVKIVAYLDDVYICSSREMNRYADDVVTSSILDHCGIQMNRGKKKESWSVADGEAPSGINDLDILNCASVWKENLDSAFNDIEVLGSSTGTCAFGHSRDKIMKEMKLIDALGHLQTLAAQMAVFVFLRRSTSQPYFTHDCTVSCSSMRRDLRCYHPSGHC